MTLPLPGSAGASDQLPDPILVAIEAHKIARAALETMVSLHSALGWELPIEKRGSRITMWEETIAAADDPRWIACERAVLRCLDEEADAACVLVNVLPTTTAAVVALLRYAVDAHGRRGMADARAIGRRRNAMLASFPDCQSGREPSAACQNGGLYVLLLLP